MNEELIPEGLRDFYRKVYTSVDGVEDERVKLALFVVLGAVKTDVATAERAANERANVVPFIRPMPREDESELAKSR